MPKSMAAHIELKEGEEKTLRRKEFPMEED
jgi:hypothetical protein